jgi:hypothetical protein
MRSARFAVFLVFILLGIGLGIGYYFYNRPRVEADQLRSLATWGLADYLAEHYADSRVLILANPFATRENMDQAVVDQEQAGIQGLRDGFRDEMVSVEVVYPTLLPDAYASPQSLIPDSSVTTPISFLLAPNALASLRTEHPDHDLWVSLIGLPVGISEQEIWKTGKGPKFALLLPDLRVIGNPAEIRSAVRAGKLAAFVLTRQGQMFDTQSMNENRREEFDKRYILVSSENVDKVMEDYPELFRMQ